MYQRTTSLSGDFMMEIIIPMDGERTRHRICPPHTGPIGNDIIIEDILYDKCNYCQHNPIYQITNIIKIKDVGDIDINFVYGVII